MNHLADLLGVSRPKRAPTFLVRLVMGKAIVEVATMHCRVSNAKAKRKLGWSLLYPDYRTGLAATVKALSEGTNESSGADE